MEFVSFNGNLVLVEAQNKTQEYKKHYISTRHHSKCFIIIHSILIKTPMRVVYYWDRPGTWDPLLQCCNACTWTHLSSNKIQRNYMGLKIITCKLSSVQSLSRVPLFATPCLAARQASLSITNSWSSPKFMSIESVMPSSHLIVCRPLLLLPPIPPSIRVFSNESTLRIRWPKH